MELKLEEKYYEIIKEEGIDINIKKKILEPQRKSAKEESINNSENIE